MKKMTRQLKLSDELKEAIGDSPNQSHRNSKPNGGQKGRGKPSGRGNPSGGRSSKKRRSGRGGGKGRSGASASRA
jgi:hypothetical protein